MNRRITRGLAMAGVMALPLSFVTGAQAAASDYTVRGTSQTGPQMEGTTPQGDVVENRNLGPGSWEFIREGIAMRAPAPSAGSDSRAGVYWRYRGSSFPGSASLVWEGSQTVTGAGSFDQAAVVVFFDYDGTSGNGNDNNALVLESVYGQDAWLSGASSDAAKAVDPSGSCPDGEGTCANDQGNNTPWFGTFAEWKSALPASATVSRVGVNLSSLGPTAEGVLRSVELNGDNYTFTDDQPTTTPQPPSCPPPPTPDPDPEPDPDPTPDPDPEPEPAPARENVRGSVTGQRDGNTLDIVLSSEDSRADGAEERNKLRWRISVVGEGGATYVQGFDEVDGYNRTFRDGTGRYVVRVFKNGDNVREYTIRTGR